MQLSLYQLDPRELCKEIYCPDLKVHARTLFDLVLDWLETQFSEMGAGPNARMYAKKVLGRLQGASLVCAAYHDDDYLNFETESLASWIKGLR